MQRSGNPWGLPIIERTDWAAGLDVPTVEKNPDFEVLYWVGCAAAYDRSARSVARAVAQLLTAAQVSFAVLGPAERCTGESARRLGEEFLFQELAERNQTTLQQHRVRKIVTHCPHCLNSLRKDYPQFGGEYEVSDKYTIGFLPQWDFTRDDFRSISGSVVRSFPDFDFMFYIGYDEVRGETRVGAQLGQVNY